MILKQKIKKRLRKVLMKKVKLKIHTLDEIECIISKLDNKMSDHTSRNLKDCINYLDESLIIAKDSELEPELRYLKRCLKNAYTSAARLESINNNNEQYIFEGKKNISELEQDISDYNNIINDLRDYLKSYKDKWIKVQ